MGVTRGVAEFAVGVALGDVPEKVVYLAKRSIIDALGLAVAGARSDVGTITRGHVESQSCGAEATILGTAVRSSARLAAFANGVAIHADDYDDTQLSEKPDRVYGLLIHPTAPVLPAAFALAERMGKSGADTLLSYLVGVEVGTKVAEAIEARHYEDGFHSTATIGAIAAAAAAGKLEGLDVEQQLVALALGASQAAGLRENFGTMIKPFHAGRAAESGVIASSLARMGFTGADNILEARRGFFNAAGGGFDEASINGRLGDPWTFASPGISIKPHPSGSLTHPAMNAMLGLVLEYDIRPEQIDRITVGASRHMPNALIHNRPVNGLQAKFSMEFCMAILVLERKAGLHQFADSEVTRPDVAEMVGKVEFRAHSDADKAGFHTMRSFVDVYLKDGTHHAAEADYAKGSPQIPMSDEELVAKLAECLEWGGVGAEFAQEVAERVMHIEEQPSLDGIVGMLRRAS